MFFHSSLDSDRGPSETPSRHVSVHVEDSIIAILLILFVRTVTKVIDKQIAVVNFHFIWLGVDGGNSHSNTFSARLLLLFYRYNLIKSTRFRSIAKRYKES